MLQSEPSIVSAAPPDEVGAPGEKGLKDGAVGFISGVVIGVASTAPGYSLAAVLGAVAAVVGLQAPAIMLLAFVPMLFIAASYYYLNRADPDCGTTFSWATRALGPWVGWIGGWGIIVADIIVMANLAEVAGIYSFLLVGVENPSKYAILAVGVLWIAVMTWICYVGVEVSAKVQWFLLAAEIFALVLFAVVALVRVYTQDIPDSVLPSLAWLNPFEIRSATALATAMLLAIFIYWGWDSTVTINEESTDATEGPGKAAVWATIILVLIYVLVAIAAQSFHGPAFLADDANAGDVLGALAHDVMGSPLDLLLVIAVLTSAAASTQTTILPTTRTALSMAAKRAAPRYWARIHTRYLTPSTATIWMGIASIVWYVGLKLISENVLYDAILALGLMIAFYYGLTGFACPIFYRRVIFRDVKSFLMIFLAPTIGGIILTWALVKSIIDLADPANSTAGEAWFGLGPPLVIAVGFMLLGVLLMVLQRWREPEFFARRPEVADPAALVGGALVPEQPEA
jgi:amino acid transporter